MRAAPLRPARLAAALLGAALPAHCMLCGARAGDVVCAPCRADYLGGGPARCRVCANPVLPGAPCCGRCLARPPPFDATVAAADYAPPLDQLVLQLKFSARLPLAHWFARTIHAAIVAQTNFVPPALLCPVPLGEARLRERGFNQALEIARPLARALGVALHPRLALRCVETRAQSSLAPGERAGNVRRAFTLAPQQAMLVRGQHVGLVDDVMTSGQTLGELAATFKRFGAARVSNLVFARTPPS